MSGKLYPSRFCVGLEIDLPNYITELLVENYIKWLKLPRPNCAFWRKNVVAKSPELKKLSAKYMAELAEVKKLLRTYDAGLLSKYIKDNNCVALKILKKPFKDKIVKDLDELSKQPIYYRGVEITVEHTDLNPAPIIVQTISFPIKKDSKINL